MLLRDSSPFGIRKPDKWKKENMIAKNIFRLDWHETKEDWISKADQTELVDGKSYLDWIVK